MPTTTCDNCKNEIPAGMDSCPKCGTHINNDGISSTQPTNKINKWWSATLILPFAVFLVWTINYAMISHPIQSALSGDSRNDGFSLSAHYSYYMDPNELILDLRKVDSAAPVDLFRAIFQSAKAMNTSGHTFKRIVLERAGKSVFLMKGDDFDTLGIEVASDQNPMYLIRTLPEKLYKNNGEPAFEHWEGGIFGVLGKQMEDVNVAARTWGMGN